LIVKELIIPYARSDEFHIYPIGDEHEGTEHHSGKALARQVEIVKNDPFGMWIGMGDKAECITPSDPRWDVGVISDWVKPDNIAECETEHWIETHLPIQKQCIGLLEGNHEDALRIHSHVDIQANICKRFKVVNLGYSCFIRFIFRRKKSTESHQFIGFFTHGSGWAITKGAKLNKLQRLMEAFDADLYATGHMHDIITDTKPYLTLDANNRIKQKEKVGAVTGCWFRTYSQDIRASYGEKKSYPPTAIGCPVFTIKPSTQEIKVEG